MELKGNNIEIPKTNYSQFFLTRCTSFEKACFVVHENHVLLPVTVTKRVQLPVFPALSVEEQFTVVVPVRKESLDVWEQVTLRSASTLSVAFEFITSLDDECSPQSVVDVTLEQLTVGTSLS